MTRRNRDADSQHLGPKTLSPNLPRRRRKKVSTSSSRSIELSLGTVNSPPFPTSFIPRISMTLWDAIIGQKPRSDDSRSSGASPSSTPSSSPDTLKDTAPGSTFEPRDFQAQDVSSLISDASLSDPSRLHPLAGLDQTSLDYLTLDDSTLSDLPGARSALPSRGWSDDLCYGTGVTYISALSVGGAWGFAEGWRRSPASAPPKLQLNSILNSVTRRGPFLGNSAGVIALVYNLINSSIGHYRGKHDAFNSVLAGALSGAGFKCTRGLRPMMISGGFVAVAAGTWTVCRHFQRNNTPTNNV